jgi:hypothetical protein
MRIEELERIMGEHPWLPKPRYVFMVKEHVYGLIPDGITLIYKGATPLRPKDRIALTADADDVTAVHEMLHLMGFGELGAYALAPRLRRLRKAIPPIFKREVKYRSAGSPHPSVEVYELQD